MASQAFTWLVEDLRDGRTPMDARKQWFVVDPDADLLSRRFLLRGTGHPLDLEATGRFVGTVLDGPFVWHVFEAPEAGHAAVGQGSQGGTRSRG